MAKLHQGKPTRYPKLEDDLFAWISEKRANGNAITQKLITNKAISLSKSPESLANNPDIIGFKFSNKWLDGFLGRYDLSERRRTTVAQQLPSDLIEKQNIFLSYIMYLRIHNNYELKYMGNMDETSILLNRDNEVLENLDNSTDENYKEYPEETNYENKWDVKVVIEVGQEEDNDESESEKEEDDSNYDYQDSDDQEEMRHRLNELKKTYKLYSEYYIINKYLYPGILQILRF
ncbi:hypothetical protein RhiirA5_382273 [Rhizophagus irregularis]|uniref:HTH CENPB-type domain-containing protein n=1 Tax=Rhizophagus irregularis TaxID=588596 RepID=A0A2N0P1I0_9GLOM|nr:hypothetical protein RhiirA5_382273 [Rhizophagus irregularis]